MIKHALITAYRAQENHHTLFDALQGLVFLSTPHLPAENSPEWQIPLGILMIQMKNPDSTLKTEIELQSIARVSELFEDLTLPVPILSTYERKKTKLKGILQYTGENYSKCILVDEKVAEISALDESLEPVDADHYNICLLDKNNKGWQKPLNFIRKCLNKELKHQIVPGEVGPVPEVSDLSKLRMRNPSSPTLSPVRAATGERPTEHRSLTSRLKKQDRRAMSLPDILERPEKRRNPKWQCYLMEPGVRLDDFFARENTFKDIDKAFDSMAGTDDDETRIVVLHGIGGIGKTSAAAEYLETRQSKFDATLWIRADNSDKVRDAFARIAVALHLLEPLQTRDRLMTEYEVKQWLQNPVKAYSPISQADLGHASWLIVFDNVEDTTVIEDFVPATGGGSILVTSRDPDIVRNAKVRSARHTPVKMEPFSSNEGAEFLRKIAPQAESAEHRNATVTVAERLDCMPLPLRQMGDWIRRNRVKFHDFLRMYQARNDHLPLLESWEQKQSAKYAHNLSTVYNLTRLSKNARSLLDVVALIDPDHISEDLLLNEDIEHAGEYPSSELAYVEARTQLLEGSLIYYNEDIREISVHRTVQDVARSDMVKSSSRFPLMIDIAAKLLLDRWPVKGRLWHYPIDHWENCQRLTPHVNQLHSNFTKSRNMKAVAPPSPSLINLLAYAGWYCHERGDPDKSKAYFDTAESLCDLPRDEDLLADLWLYQGCVATETNDGDSCLEYYKKRLERTQRLIPSPQTLEDFDDLAIAYNEMGVGYLMKDKVEEAREMLEVAKFHSDKKRRESKTATSVFMLACANLGLAYWLEDHWEDALNVLMQAYQVYEKKALLGEKEAFVPGRLMHALGNVKISQGLDSEPADIGDLDRGFDWHQKAYEHYTKTIGEAHHRTADVSHRLGDDYIKRVDYANGDRSQDLPNARLCLDRALKVFNSKRCYTPEKMRTLHLKALLRKKEGRDNLAEPLFKESQRMFEEWARQRNVSPPDKRLRQKDFDEAVTFWSR